MEDGKSTIRKATKEDIPLIVAMLANDPLGKKREHYQIPIPQPYVQAFRNIDKDPQQELMVLVSPQGKVIGTFQLSFLQYLTYQGGIRAQIEGVRVHPDHRGKGIGKEMVTWAIARAKEKGAHVIQLTSDKKRPKAHLFYEKMGFRATHEGMKLPL